MVMPGTVGPFPPPAWRAVVELLSSPVDDPDKAWRATVLEMRRVCATLHALVGQHCVGGAAWLDLETTEEAGQLEKAPTIGLGRALVVRASLSKYQAAGEQSAIVAALGVAVERGHMVSFAFSGQCAPAVGPVEAILVEASREGLLLGAYLHKGEALGWSLGAMAQLSTIELFDAEHGTVAAIVGAGALHRVQLVNARWADLSILSSLREVKLHNCLDVEDLYPLADVDCLVVWWCPKITALPAMRNNVLEVGRCKSLVDTCDLAGGRVGHLELLFLASVEDVSAIGAMQPPPRTVVLEGMDQVQDVSMLAGIHRLEVIECPNFEKAAALEALEGKVGTIRWQ